MIMPRTIRILRFEMVFWIMAFIVTFASAILYDKKEKKDMLSFYLSR